jgi:catechol 2,3-dioxygenase-like lactoylglutathione lyase family enzyme
MHHPTLSVADLSAAADFYTKTLGFQPGFTWGDPPIMAGVELTFGHRLPERTPPIEIERVEVGVRLEKRLAALLEELAARKRMDVSSCLEDILLHSFEQVGEDASPSPHTKSTFRYIEALKRRHGIDYDAHASYRFVERQRKP